MTTPVADVSQTVYSTLANDATVSSLVGDRIYPVWVSNVPAKPYITYRLISATPQNTLDDDPLVDQRRIQIDAWADSYASAHAVESAVRDALQRFGKFVNINEFEESDVRLYRVSMDLSIFGQK